eukprot:scaffold351275_cov53-Prasinocladus_malaysianus.AAC.1
MVGQYRQGGRGAGSTGRAVQSCCCERKAVQATEQKASLQSAWRGLRKYLGEIRVWEIDWTWRIWQ